MSTSESATPHLYVETLAASRTEMRATSTQLFRRVLACVELTADFFTCAAGTFAAFSLDLSWHMGRLASHPMREVSGASFAVGFFAVLFLQRTGVYRGGGSLLQIRETERAIRIPVQSVLLLLAFTLLLDMRLSNATVLISLFLIPVLLILQKLAFFSIIRKLHGMGYGMDRVVIYGAGDGGKRIVPGLFHSVRLGLLPVAVIDDDPALDGSYIFEMGYRRRRSVPVQRGPVTAELLKSWQSSMLIVALPNLSSERQAAAVDAAIQAGLKIAFLSGVELQEQQWTQ